MFRLVNARRLRREYRAEIEVDGEIVGYVERAQSSKMLGYRAGEYRAHVDGVVAATAATLADLRIDLLDHFEAERSI